ncbi:hypothetical protein ANN_24690 [Periplaneta americana]|uniref:Transposable element P transposase-like RNase H domain-containing protein n=1 Tax=Periplaneta americana TaxID=6978 RepID=A0ABQ8RZH1_PERAM|nr:hypothetical protein ANN_24690 [Periplaneta americana]
MNNEEWKAANFELRHHYTRGAIHGFHYRICTRKGFHQGKSISVGIIFHDIPSAEELRERWLAVIRRQCDAKGTPSRSALDRYMGHTDCDVGISKLVKDRLKAECETLLPTEKIVSVIIEEMAIKERFIYDRTTDKFIEAVNTAGL